MKRSKLTLISGIFVGSFVLVALLAPWLASPHSWFVPFGPDTPSIEDADILTAPGNHILGTDRVGRDLFALLVYGIRGSLFFSAVVVLFCVLVGVLIGGLMGFLGGKVDLVLSRFLEIIANFPIFFLQLTLLAFFPQNYWILFGVMVIAGWIPYCRFTRAEFLKLRNQDYVQAATAIGCSKARIFFKHLLPNSWTPSIIFIPFDLSSTIVVLGALSFLGFGEPINVPSLGELMNQAKTHFREAWWIAVFPSATVFILTLSLTLFGMSIRDLLDPKE